MKTTGLIALLLLPFITNAQQRRAPEDPVAALARTAAALNPEFAADVLLRIVHSGRIKERKAQIELIERAFTGAQRATEPYPVIPVPIGFTDAPTAMIGMASRVQIDRLSLCSRAVRQMTKINHPQARAMLEAVVVPEIPIRTCEATAVPDLRFFYDNIAILARRFLHAAGDQARKTRGVDRPIYTTDRECEPDVRRGRDAGPHQAPTAIV